MSWEEMGAIGEVVGAIGVLITLVFLVQQLRQNTRALRAEGFHNAAVMIHHPTTLMIQDAEVAEIHARGNESYESLGPVERDRYHYLLIQRMHAIEVIDGYLRAGVAEGWWAESCRLIVIRLAAKPGFRRTVRSANRRFGSIELLMILLRSRWRRAARERGSSRNGRVDWPSSRSRTKWPANFRVSQRYHASCLAPGRLSLRSRSSSTRSSRIVSLAASFGRACIRMRLASLTITIAPTHRRGLTI